VEVMGRVLSSQGKKQSLELQVVSLKLIGDCDASSYPLQKKRHR
jgi:asparaginyl-tRNA synthetase